MISLVSAAALAVCVPLIEADRFGEIPFAERITADAGRLLSLNCDVDGCTGRDSFDVIYRHNGEWILQKIVDGPGPLAASDPRLAPASDGSGVLSAPVCGEGGVWLELDLTKADRPIYGLFAQP